VKIFKKKMIRRKFLKILAAGAKPLFLFPFLSRPGSVFAQGAYDGKIRLNNPNSNVHNAELHYYLFDNEPYISLNELAEINHYSAFTNNDRRKTVIYVGGNKIKFTAENSFVVVDGSRLYQYPKKSKWKNNAIWVPVSVLCTVFSQYTTQKMKYSARQKELQIGLKNINIPKIVISDKENGYLLKISALKKFRKSDILLKEANGWLHVDIVGGKADEQALNRKNIKGFISEIQAIQFEQMVSIAFKLKHSISSREVYIDPNSNDIYVTLRTDRPPKQDEVVESDLEAQKKEWLVDTIVIDPGHGGKDPGAVGYGRLREKDIVLPVALKLGKALKKRVPGVKIVYTRKTDVFVPLWKRTKMANENKGKLFISLHCNANRNKKARGFETYFLSAEKDSKAKGVVLQENQSIQFEGESDKKRYEGINFVLATMAQNAFIKQSQYLASTVQKALSARLKPEGMKSRGVKQGPFWVMVGATMPNILVEMGFISNKYEAGYLKKRSTQQKMADSICDGLLKYKTDFESTI
jgi:N-acetylmuramoyl-L-alanine amidase